MKRTIFILCSFFSLFLGSSCEKESNNDLDILKNKWKLINIIDGNNLSEPTTEYILEFTNDSLFIMNLSINTAGGKYRIEEKNQISILSYSLFTEICCESTFDIKLIDTFKKVTRYNIDENNLIFFAENLKIEFEKK